MAKRRVYVRDRKGRFAKTGGRRGKQPRSKADIEARLKEVMKHPPRGVSKSDILKVRAQWHKGADLTSAVRKQMSAKAHRQKLASKKRRASMQGKKKRTGIPPGFKGSGMNVGQTSLNVPGGRVRRRK